MVRKSLLCAVQDARDPFTSLVSYTTPVKVIKNRMVFEKSASVLRDGIKQSPSEDQALPCANASVRRNHVGRAWCTLDVFANAAPFQGCLPSTNRL